jgi:hypothetical protein
MNIKAERIEQLIQLVNRNLYLIFSGHRDGSFYDLPTCLIFLF